MSIVRIVLSTIDDSGKARELAEKLVEERLAACVNIIPRLTSVYKWKGKTEIEEEILLVIKTAEDRLPNLLKRLVDLHPYDTPEAIALPVEQGHEDYLEWVVTNTRVVH